MEAHVQIEALAFGGSGVGRLAGKVVFVPYTAAGDLVHFRSLREKKQYIEGELISVVSPSTERRVPPCPVFGQCGGCQWQHLPYDQQVFWKQNIYNDFLTRRLNVPTEVLRPFVPAPDEWNYRSRMQFKCRQTPKGFVVGFYRRGSHFVIDVTSCPIAVPPINQVMSRLRPFLAASPCPDLIPQLDIALDDEGRIAVIVHCLAADLSPLADYLLPVALQEGCALYLQSGRKQTLTCVTDPVALHIHPLSDESLRLAYPVGGFAQVNLRQNRRLVADVLDAAAPLRGQRVLDLYCGMGNFSLPLAHAGAEVCGVEDFAPAIDCARRNAQQNHCTCTFYCMTAHEALAGPLAHQHFDLVLLDPPRTGARDVIPELLRLKPPRILYVSCDPSTLARDLVPLVHNGYRVCRTQGIDLFPQTYHIESLTCLERT